MICNLKGVITEPYGLSGEIKENNNMDVKLDIPIFKKEKYSPSYISFYKFDGTNLDYEIKNLNTINIKNMTSMFSNLSNSNLVELDLSSFNTSNVETMNSMFLLNTKLKNINVTGFNTSKVRNFNDMFRFCYALTEIKGIENFDMRSASDIITMFDSCYNLVDIDISKWECSRCLNAGSLFSNCLKLSDNSLHSILKMCLTFPDSHTLKYLGLNETQANTCITFPEWKELSAKNWTTGY